MKDQRIAIWLMIAQGVLFAAETAAIHQIGAGASVMQLALTRSAGGVLLAVGLAWNVAGSVLRTRQLPLQLLRGGVTLLYLWVLIYSFAAMPFADATAISFTQTGYIALFSKLILGETVDGARWGAAVIGLSGALLIAKPAFAGWNSAYLIALAGTSLNGLAFVLNRYLQRQDSQATTMFYSNVIPLLGNFSFIFLTGLPDGPILVWLPAIFLLGPLGMFAGMMAVRRANAATLGPFTLLQLVIAVPGSAVIFHELPNMYSVAGTILIIMSCIISTAAGITGGRSGGALRPSAMSPDLGRSTDRRRSADRQI